MTTLLDLIESRRFLGREFLAWLWFESEMFEAVFETKKFGSCMLYLDKTLTLEAMGTKEKEQSKLRGVAPSARAEAKEALRQAKYPTVAHISIKRGEQDFSLMFNADKHGMSGVKIPSLLKEEGDDPFFERIALIEELETLFDELYADFLKLRLSTSWSTHALPAMRAWVRDQDNSAIANYRQQRERSFAAHHTEHVGGSVEKAKERGPQRRKRHAELEIVAA